MRRALALAALIAVSATGAAHAEAWAKFANGDNGTEWSYDKDYTYKDRETGRIVVMQAISKPSAGLMPGGPDKGVGYVYALDCDKHNLIMITAYKPSKPFEIPTGWRSVTPKKAGGSEDESLFNAVCPTSNRAPVK